MKAVLLIPEFGATLVSGWLVHAKSNTVEDNVAKWAMNIILGKTPETTPKPGVHPFRGPVGEKLRGAPTGKETSTSGRHQSERQWRRA